MKTKRVAAADLFCGAGGTSQGMLEAAQALGFELNLVAVNHWPLAIETHLANHPWARHVCASLTSIDLGEDSLFPSIDAIDPRRVVPNGKLDVLIASPECMHHSIARGGRPRSDQSRSSAWCILRWADMLRPSAVLIENVPEFRSWGPLGVNGKPLKRQAGRTYQAFLNALDSLGYTVEDRILNAADYGDATTRRRLFIMATRGRRKPVWPQPTHAKDAVGGLDTWRSARDIIDWELPSQSIFGRKRPLSEKTIARIAAGLERFCGEVAEPFLVMLYGTGKARGIDRPVPTITGGGQHIGLCQPFLLPHRQFKNMNADSVDRPVRTITGASRDIQLVQPFIVPQFGERKGQPPRTHAVDEPLPAVTSHGAGALVEPFLIKYYGHGGGPRTVREPLGTLTTRDRYGLVQPDIQDGNGNGYVLDIHLRMLHPLELAAAMSFPPGYRFIGGRTAQVKQIGNAVPVRTARALCTEAIG